MCVESYQYYCHAGLLGASLGAFPPVYFRLDYNDIILHLLQLAEAFYLHDIKISQF